VALKISKYRLLLLLSLPWSALGTSSWASDSVTPVTKKFGYFDLKVIRNTFPDSVTFEQSRYNGEDRLRNSANEANQQLKQFESENHSVEEIQRERLKLQSSVDAKTNSFVQQMLASNLNIIEKIKQAASTVAEARGVDVVLDANSVFFGGGKILDGGIDVTADMMKILGTNPSE
jgi:Skp family chaperone for outer membrane proteins